MRDNQASSTNIYPRNNCVISFCESKSYVESGDPNRFHDYPDDGWEIHPSREKVLVSKVKCERFNWKLQENSGNWKCRKVIPARAEHRKRKIIDVKM
jgi:hypothetical protein